MGHQPRGESEPGSRSGKSASLSGEASGGEFGLSQFHKVPGVCLWKGWLMGVISEGESHGWGRAGGSRRVRAEDSGDLRNLVKTWTGRQKEEQGARSQEPRP